MGAPSWFLISQARANPEPHPKTPERWSPSHRRFPERPGHKVVLTGLRGNIYHPEQDMLVGPEHECGAYIGFAGPA
jgi:hypothetical protein